jgi:N-glycosylase/DNA lyase
MDRLIKASDFSLSDTLESGQAFRWTRQPDGAWIGVAGRGVWRVRQDPDGLRAERLGGADPSWSEDAAAWLTRYFALDLSLVEIVASFPDDPGLAGAVRAHFGLRILRQEPWECLASFIASSTKRIVQIRQITARLARMFGAPIHTPAGVFHCFPSPADIARASHRQLLDCKLGFRAAHLLAAARAVDSGALPLPRLARMELEQAEAELTRLRGVGEKIAGCVLLFSCGFHRAFPVDVWIERALRRIYFAERPAATRRQLRAFARTHFGPYGGWAQQYLFFAERARRRQPLGDAVAQR